MKKKICIRFFAFLFTLLMLLSVTALTAAANTVVPKTIAQSDVMDDLSAMEGYDQKRYTADEALDYCEIIDLIEFGYDYDGRTNDYGLYLYVYNPSCKPIETNTAYKNRVQLRVSSTAENIAGGDTPWKKYTLVYLDKSSDDLFYKFKINIPNSFMREPEKNMRIYEIADLELFFENENSIRSVGASGMWMYSGFQEYHDRGGKNEVSTLYWDSKSLMTLDLKLNQATWKTKTSTKGPGWAYELFSCYFAVPDKIIEDYGDPNDPEKGLVRVDYSYEKHFIEGISTSGANSYKKLIEYAGKDIKDGDHIPYGFMTEHYSNAIGYVGKNMFFFNPEVNWYSANRYASGYESLSSFGNVFMGNYLGIYKESFEEQILEKREKGELISDPEFKEYFVEADGGDIAQKIVSLSKATGSYDFWDWLTGYIPYPDEDYSNILPIVAVDEGYIEDYIDSACGEKYFISEEDSGEFCDFVDENSSDKTTFIIRFALDDYYSSDIMIFHEDEPSMGIVSSFGNGNYYFRKNVYLDFDVLSLTWEKENGKRTVIPVKATPINVVGNVSPPHEEEGFFKKAGDAIGTVLNCGSEFLNLRSAGFILGFVGILFVFLFFKPLRKLLKKLLNALGKFFGWLFDLISKPFKKKGKKKNSKEESKVQTKEKEKDKKKDKENIEKEKKE